MLLPKSDEHDWLNGHLHLPYETLQSWRKEGKKENIRKTKE